jgi:hypothetical protein
MDTASLTLASLTTTVTPKHAGVSGSTNGSQVTLLTRIFHWRGQPRSTVPVSIMTRADQGACRAKPHEIGVQVHAGTRGRSSCGSAGGLDWRAEFATAGLLAASMVSCVGPCVRRSGGRAAP